VQINTEIRSRSAKGRLEEPPTKRSPSWSRRAEGRRRAA